MRRTGKSTVNASLGGDFDLNAGGCAEKMGLLKAESTATVSGAPCPPRGPEMVAGEKSRSWSAR